MEKIPQSISSATINILFVTLAVYMSVNAFYKLFITQLHIPDMNRQFKTSLSKDISLNEKNYPLTSYKAINKRNLFNVKDKNDVSSKSAKTEISSLDETLLKLKLYGTVTGNKAYAVIRDLKQRKQQLYSIGDTLQGALIKNILRDKIILSVNGNDEILSIEKRSGRYARTSGTGSSVPGKIASKQNISISRSTVDKAMNNINSLMKQARIRPHFRNGKPDGLTLSRIRRGSIFQKLGLRSGDILKGVNGENIRSVDDALNFYNSLKNASDMNLQIKRRGRDKEIEYSIR